MSSPEHRKRAKAKLAGKLKKSVETFVERVKTEGPSVPDDDEVVQVLRCLIHSKPGGDHAQATTLGKHAWRQDSFAKKWPGCTAQTLIDVLSRRRSAPPGGYPALHDALAKVAAPLLGLRDEHIPALLAEIRRERSDLHECLDDCFDFAARSLVAFEPHIYSPLDEEPYWERAGRGAGPEPLAKELANTVFAELRDNKQKRLVYVHGPHFSAKREILKAVVGRLEANCLVRHDNTRLPALAIAAESVSVEVFVDRVFKFFASRVPASAAVELARNLSMDDKIAFIRAAAQTAPVLFIVADVEPFDADATIRRLRGDRIGDVIQTVLDANRETRVLVGVISDADLPWEADAISVGVHAVQDELIEAIGGLSPTLARKYQRILTPGEANPRGETALDSLVMRLVIAVFERSKGKARLAVASGPFEAALKAKSAEAVFDCIWRDMIGPSDRLLLGLIATSFDGLRAATLIKLLKALRGMACDADTGIALAQITDDPDALIAWARTYDRVVRLRDDGGPNATSFYFRDAIRRQVLRAWVRDYPNQSRDGFWCLAREAADQANRHILKEGASDADFPLARNLQALKALLASIDPNTETEADAPRNLLALPITATDILPPLAVPARTRPNARVAYIFAWHTLYEVELERGEIDVDDRLSTPATRLSALLAFLIPSAPWSDTEAFDLSLAGKSFDESMGLAARALSPPAQLDLLTRLAISAYRARRFTLVLAALDLIEELQRRAPSLPVTALVRAYRLRLSLGLLYCGNPVLRDPGLWPKDLPTFGAEQDFKLGWAIGEAERLHAMLPADDSPEAVIARGKLNMREGALEHWAGARNSAARAFVRGWREEFKLITQGYQSADRLPVSLGKGASAVVRYMLWRQRYDACDVLTFPADGFSWPTPKPVTGAAMLAFLRILMEGNARRARRAAPGARLNVRLDQARLAMSLGEFAQAELELVEAQRIASRGAAFETLFQLADLRACLAVEVAMRTLPDASGEMLSKVNAALDSLRKLQRLGPLPLIDAVLRYYEAQALVVESRVAKPQSTESRQTLIDAKEALIEAQDMMEDAGLGLCRVRIARTLSAVESALR